MASEHRAAPTWEGQASQTHQALHESAHGLIAELLGIEITQVSLDPPECRVVLEPDQQGDWLRAVMAGVILDHRFHWYSSADNHRADRLVRALGLGEVEVERLWSETSGLIAQFWPTLVAIAVALIGLGTLSGQQLSQIVTGANYSNGVIQ